MTLQRAREVHAYPSPHSTLRASYKFQHDLVEAQHPTMPWRGKKKSHHQIGTPATVKSIASASYTTCQLVHSRPFTMKVWGGPTGGDLISPIEAVCVEWCTFVVVGTTVLIVPFCMTVHVNESDVAAVLWGCPSVDKLSVNVVSGASEAEGVGDASVAVTKVVGRLEPKRLLMTSEGTMDPGRTVTLPAASVAEK